MIDINRPTRFGPRHLYPNSTVLDQSICIEKMTFELVKSINALPRKEMESSDEVLNEWHFDFRYIQLEPNPSHVITLIQPQSQIIHIERLPVGLPTNQSGIEYFLESGKEAAPEVPKALLHALILGNPRQPMPRPRSHHGS